MKASIKLLTATAIAGIGIAATATPSAYAANTVINSSIGSVISLFTTSGTVSLNVTPSAGGSQTIAADTVTVSTNAQGYTLQLADTDTNTSLVSGSNNITAASGTQASPAALTAGTWGYRVDGLGGFGSSATAAVSNQSIGSTTFAGVPAAGSAATIKSTSSAATNDKTSVWYSVAANSTQAPGTYTDTVTYTAVAK